MLHALIFTLLTSSGIANQPSAQEEYEAGKKLAEQMLNIIPLTKKTSPQAISEVSLQGETAKRENRCASSFREETEIEANTQKREDEILVFVSFSMSLETLKALASEAQRYNARLVIRGLIDNSFKKTTEKLMDFPSGLEINPSLFKEFQIDKVPTFILMDAGKEQHRLSGNITLSYAAEKLKEGA